MRPVLIAILAHAARVLYFQFSNDKGQFLVDREGGVYHAVSGSNLNSESSDVLLTTRGAYFNGAAYVTLPVNQVIKSSFALNTSFSVWAWISPSTSGPIFSIVDSDTTKVKAGLSFTTLAFSTTLRTSITTSAGLTASLTLSSWYLVVFSVNYDGVNSNLKVIYATTLGAVTGLTQAVVGPIIDATTKVAMLGTDQSGGYFTGYIWESAIYDTASTTANVNSAFDTLLSCSGGCLYCPSSGTCLSTQTNPLKSDNGTSCSCSGKSCTNAPVCIECSGCNYESCNSAGSCVYPSSSYCSIDCSSCTGPNSNECTGCSAAGTTLSSGTCVCSSNYFASGTNPLVCTSCYQDCSTCTGPNSNECSGCNAAGTTLSSGTCVCNSNFFASGTNPLVCTGCHQDCSTCTGSSSNQCTGCNASGSTLSSGTCVCSSNYFASGTNPLVCTSCYQDCSTCTGSNSNQCTGCSAAGTTLSSGTCVCSVNYFASGTNPLVCTSCYQDCSTCTGPNSNECTGCSAAGTTLSSGTCVCSSNYYDSGTSPLVCTSCNVDCLTCNGGSSYECLSCSDPHATQSAGTCICDQGFYASIVSPLTCTTCSSECLTCDGGTDSDCLTCSASNASATSGVCTCNSGFFTSAASPLSCSPCSSECFSCDGGTDSDCLVCAAPNATTSSGVCACDSSFYTASLSPLTCSACSSECLTCEGSSSHCLTCPPANASASNGVCSCKAGFVASSLSPLNCSACPKECSTCNLEGKCITCFDSFARAIEGACVCLDNTTSSNSSCGTCSSGYYHSSSTELCEACSLGCSTCSAWDVCTACSDTSKTLQSDGTCRLVCEDELDLIDDKCVMCYGGLCSDCLCSSCVSEAVLISVGRCECTADFVEQENQCVQMTLPSTTSQNPSDDNDYTAFTASALISASIMSVSVFSNPNSAWGLLNTMQMLDLMPLINVQLPDELFEFLKSLLIIDYLPNFAQTFMPDDGETPYALAVRVGFDSSLFLINSGTTITLFILVLLSWPLYLMLSRVRNNIIGNYFSGKVKEFIWNVFIRFWLETFLELTFNSVLNLLYFSFDSPVLIMNSLFSLVYGLVFVFGPVALMCFLKAKRSQVSEDFKSKYDTLFCEFKDPGRVWVLHFYTIFLVRRMLYVMSLIFLRQWPYFQIFFNVLHSVLSLIYVVILKPYPRFLNYFNIFQEAVLSLTFLSCTVFSFTDEYDSIISKSIMALVMTCAVFGLALNLKDLIVYLQSLRRNSPISPTSTDAPHSRNASLCLLKSNKVEPSPEKNSRSSSPILSHSPIQFSRLNPYSLIRTQHILQLTKCEMPSQKE